MKKLYIIEVKYIVAPYVTATRAVIVKAQSRIKATEKAYNHCIKMGLRVI